MSLDDALHELDGVGTAEAIRRGQVSPADVLEAFVDRVERVDPEINAVVRLLTDEAQQELETGATDRAFWGVPMLWKDTLQGLAGHPVAYGTTILRDADYRLPGDTPLGSAVHDAGFVSVGRTNIPEISRQLDTQPQAFGPTHNPYDPERSVGGSSGGAAAAVAAGIVPIAHGNDAGGSLRIPAGWCGVVGLKPSRGRVPSRTTNTSATGVEGFLTRTMRDAAAVLDAVADNPPGAWFSAPPFDRPLAEHVGRPSERLRIGVQTAADGVQVHPECVVAVQRTADLLSDAGHDVQEARPAVPPGDLGRDGRIVSASDPAEVRAVFRFLGSVQGRPVTESDVDPWTWSRAAWDQDIRPEDVVLELQQAAHTGWELARWWDDWDLLLTPTAAQPPLPLTALSAQLVDPSTLLDRILAFGCFRLAANRTGHPAISLPVHWSADGLPVGVQLVAGRFRDDLLIEVGSYLEQAMPWAQRRPPIHVSRR